MRPPGGTRRNGIPVLVIGAILFLGLIVCRHHYTLSPIGIGLSRHEAQLYPPNDHWAAFLPAPETCPGSTDPSASTAAAEGAMICALNYARVRDGLSALPVSPLLQRSARLKALDIIRCQDFSHAACGKNPRAVADEVGYPNVDWGENIYAGPGPFAAARVGADAWLNSPHHRENHIHASAMRDLLA
jgi:uncharacterized protein YkwD